MAGEQTPGLIPNPGSPGPGSPGPGSPGPGSPGPGSPGPGSPGRVRITYRKLHPEAGAPSRGTAGAAAYDLYAVGDVTIAPGEVAAVDTGLAIQIPAGHVGLVADRSGLASRGITTRHANRDAAIAWLRQLGDEDPLPVGGVIDEDYRGPWRVLLANVGSETHRIAKGDRVAQFAVFKLADCEPVECPAGEGELSETARGEGGFGSTGR